MSPWKKLAGFVLVAAFAVAAWVPAARADVGLQVYMQPWNPTTDNDAPQQRINSASMISGFFLQDWRRESPASIDSFRAELGRADAITEGVTLYDIDLNLPDPSLDLSAVSGGGARPLQLVATTRFAGVSFEATARQPTMLGRYADPRCSARFDLEVDVRFTVGPDGHAPFSTDLGPRDIVPARVSNFSWDSQNVACDLIYGAVSLGRLHAAIAQAAQEGANSRRVSGFIVRAFSSAIERLNAQATSAVPASLSQVSAWLDGAPNARRLTLAFSPPPAADDGRRVSIFGSVSYAGAIGVRGAQPASIDCGQFQVSAAWKTGPRPIINARGELGEAPLQPVAVTLHCGTVAQGASASFLLSGLARSFPTLLTFTPIRGGCSGTGLTQFRRSTHAGFTDWDNDNPIPPSRYAQAFQLQATMINEPCRVNTEIQIGPIQREIDPVVNPQIDRGQIITQPVIIEGAPAAPTPVQRSPADIIRQRDVGRITTPVITPPQEAQEPH